MLIYFSLVESDTDNIVCIGSNPIMSTINGELPEWLLERTANAWSLIRPTGSIPVLSAIEKY